MYIWRAADSCSHHVQLISPQLIPDCILPCMCISETIPVVTSYLHFIISRCFLHPWFLCNLPRFSFRSWENFIREEKRAQDNVEIMPTSIPVRSIDGSDDAFLFFLLILNSSFYLANSNALGIGNDRGRKIYIRLIIHQGSALTAHVVVCLMIFDWLVSLPSSQSSLVAVIVVEFAWWPKFKLPVFGLNGPSSWETSVDWATLVGAFPEPRIVEPADLPLPEP